MPLMKKVTPLVTLLLSFAMMVSAQNWGKLEAEDAVYSNCKIVSDKKYSGGKALELTEENASITFTFHAAKSGKYVIAVGYDGLYGEKLVNLSVNGNSATFKTTVNGLGETTQRPYLMNQGNNTVVITPNWTWFRIDYICISGYEDTVTFNIAPTPIDIKATEPAMKMYAFLRENFGKKTISGIMTGDMATANGNVTQQADVMAVYEASGKYPALIGFDFMNATGAAEDDSWSKAYTRAVIDLAKDTWQRGGLPNFTWHWRDPSRRTGEFYTDKCQMKISDALKTDGTWNTTSTLYKNIIRDIDFIADYLLELQNEGVACLFRPLHEASGGWFWWGREGAENFIKLYQLLWHEMVNVKGVHNVIWIWNATPDDIAWNPGYTFYDIVSADIYNNDFDYSSSYITFDGLKSLTKGKKIIALSENGPIPDIEKEVEEDAVWSWWMPWYQTWGGNFVDKTRKEEWVKCMSDPRVITLDDLSAGWNEETAIHPPNADHKMMPCKWSYTLDGRTVKCPRKGIYVRNGEKVFVK